MEETKSGYIQFINHHLPTLESGAYTLEITPSIKVANTADIDLREAKMRSELIIEGPRFQLDPQLVRSVYPAQNSIGTYENIFPHIIFNRSTLLWERRIEQDVLDEGTSWMALLVFDTSEVEEGAAEPTRSKVKPSVKTVGDLPEKLRRNLEISQQLADKVSVIEVPRKLLARAMPKNLENLRLLSHIRHPSDTQDKTLDQADESTIFPILIGSRLPKPDSRSIVYLVSLEGQGDLFDDEGEFLFQEYARCTGNNAPEAAAGSADPAEDQIEQLVVLYSWSFAAQGDSGKFHESFERLAKNSKSFHPNLVQNESANVFLREGYLPLEHQTRTGNRLVSFYRSPFIPMPSGSPPEFKSLVTRSADELLRLHSIYSMYDVTYAAAWELGRMLTVQNRRVALDLYRWKRSYRHHQRYLHDGEVQQVTRNHLPNRLTILTDPIPESVIQWFEELARYEHIPFNYLVPTAGMLPPESFRAFYFDRNWQTHYLSGAFSVGHVPGGDKDNAEQRTIVAERIETARNEYQFGILIRSTAVSDFPHVHIEGIVESGDSVAPVAPIKQERLGTDILFLVFAQEIKGITFSQAPEAIHFGLLREVEPNRYVKKGEDIANREPQGKQYTINDEELDAVCRNINFVAVAEAVLGSGSGANATDDSNSSMETDPKQKFRPKSTFEAHDLALLMIEGVPKVRIDLEGAAS